MHNFMEFERVYRHGDVLLFKVAETGVTAHVKERTKKLTLELGEVTGHSHQLAGDVEVLDSPVEKDQLLFRVTDQAVLTHEEHERIVLEKGVYLKVSQVEYDPFQDLIVRIRD
ncbi:hypothetical protein QNI16_34750 [Cytophagaceae bacterium YF14B1]|uniref:Uncharacterized protein n=1 Tax=Xanthocytophaga flava TaxID=3048013 RepID=A0AAE3QUL0_9BACT|nr:hypothetical protein [Xanthocytophaga flavus]MDJ1485692.1 hypothetical protein [Xanthocytophaga flavus]